MNQFLESVNSFLSGGDQLPWCSRDIIAVSIITLSFASASLFHSLYRSLHVFAVKTYNLYKIRALIFCPLNFILFLLFLARLAVVCECVTN